MVSVYVVLIMIMISIAREYHRQGNIRIEQLVVVEKPNISRQ